MREQILELIPYGSENAILQADLCQLLNITPSVLKSHIQALRRSGAEICSGQHGYFRPANREELRLFVKRMDKQSTSRFVTVKPCRQGLRETEGQEHLNIVANEAMHGKTEKES